MNPGRRYTQREIAEFTKAYRRGGGGPCLRAAGVLLWCGAHLGDFVGGDGGLEAAFHSKGKTASFQHNFIVF